MASRWTRRGFLVLLASGLVGGYAALAWRTGEASDVIVAILRRRVGHLQIEPGVFEAFSSKYLESRASYRRQLRWLAVAAGPLRLVTPYRFLPMGHPLRRLEDNVVTRFLMSTDFFQHGADETRPVQYLAFHDPPTTACQNFIARRRDQIAVDP